MVVVITGLQLCLLWFLHMPTHRFLLVGLAYRQVMVLSGAPTRLHDSTVILVHTGVLTDRVWHSTHC